MYEGIWCFCNFGLYNVDVFDEILQGEADVALYDTTDGALISIRLPKRAKYSMNGPGSIRCRRWPRGISNVARKDVPQFANDSYAKYRVRFRLERVYTNAMIE